MTSLKESLMPDNEDRYIVAPVYNGKDFDVCHQIMQDFNKMGPQKDVEYVVYVDTRNRTIRWCCAYDTFIGKSCRCSIANIAFPYLPKKYLRDIFAHAFITRGAEIILITTYGSNIRSLEFTKKLGFVEAFRLPEGAVDGSDYIISTMKRSDCRFIPKENRGP